MTLRQQLDDEVSGIHDQVDAILDSEDSMIILIDARRAINYVRGFALSPCQLELLATDIERLVRTIHRAREEASCLTDTRPPQSHRPGHWPHFRRA